MIPARVSLAGLMGFVLLTALGLVALKQADPLWASLTFSLAVLVLSAVALHAIFGLGRARAFWIGFATTGWIYLVGAFFLFAPDGFDSPPMLTQLGLDRLRTFLHPERVVTTIDFLPTPIPWLPISAPMRLAPLASIPIIPLAGSDRLAPVPGTASEPSDSELTPTLPSVSEIPSPASMPTLPPPPPAPPTPMAAAMATTSTSTTFTFSAPGTVVTGSSAEAIHLNQVGHSLAALLVAQAGGCYSLFLAARRDRRRDELAASVSPSSP